MNYVLPRGAGRRRITAVEVQCHAGYKADEYPVRFLVGDAWIDVKEVLDRWYQGDCDPGQPVSDYYKVVGTDVRQYLLKHDRESDEWHLVGPHPPEAPSAPGN